MHGKLLQVDNLIALVFSRPLRLLCRLTGRDNYAYGMAAIYGAFLFALADTVYGYRKDIATSTVIASAIWAAVLLGFVAVAHLGVRSARAARNANAALPPPVIPGLLESPGKELLRPVLAIYSPVMLFDTVLFALSCLMWATALYWFTDLVPPGRSALSKVLEHLRAHHTPELAPHPA